MKGLLLACLLPPLGVGPQTTDPLRQLPLQETVAFVDVAVIPMDRERLLDHQTVIVAAGRIVAVGSVARTKVPEGARRVEGRGRFLLPGLADMDVRFANGAGSITDPAGQQMALLLGAGVTAVRGVDGSLGAARTLRDKINAGTLLGPRLIVGSPVPAAGKKRSLPKLEHLDGYVGAVLEDGTPVPDSEFLADVDVLSHVEPWKVAALARNMAELGIWNAPNLAVFETIASGETLSQLGARAEMRFATPDMIRGFSQQMRTQVQIPATGRRRFLDVRRQLVRSLYASGAKLLIGSGAPQFFIIPGEGTVREIEAFVAAGLSPYAAVEAATRNAAGFNQWTDVGSIAVGNRADLVLLRANPLQRIGNIRLLDGVMVNGRWLDSQRLTQLRESVASTNSRR